MFVLIIGLVLAGVSVCQCNTLDVSYRGSSMANESDRNYHSSMLCLDLRPQKSVDLHEMMGLWYGVEIIVHNKAVPGIFTYHSCVQVHLSDFTDQMLATSFYRPTSPYSSSGVTDRFSNSPQNQQHQYQQQQQQRQYQSPQQQNQPSQTPPQLYYRSSYQSLFDPNNGNANNNNNNNNNYNNNNNNYNNNDNMNNLNWDPKYLQLIWSENDSNLEYILNYTDLNRGVWSNVQPQRGSLAIPNQYTQFTGTVQVVKAVGDHIVLTFCSNNMKSSIYTIVLSRNRGGLSEDVKRSIRSLLYNRGLSVDTIRQVCTSSASKVKSFTAFIFIALTFIPILRKLF